MIVCRNRHRKVVAAGLAGLVIAAGTAFAASNTVVNRNAGAGTGQVAGFSVENVGYVPGSNPEFIATVSFDITRDNDSTVVESSNAKVLVSLDGGTTYFPCTVGSGAAVCEITEPVAMEDIDTVDVVAYDFEAAMGY